MLEIIKDGFEFSETPEFEFAQTNEAETEHDSFIIEVCKKTENDLQKT